METFALAGTPDVTAQSALPGGMTKAAWAPPSRDTPDCAAKLAG
jgi:hypothetical protein